MATYKVIQDVEAEDKLLGPLSLRQFIYAIIVVVLGFISFRLLTVQPLLIIPFLPPMVLFAVLAAPFGHDQSSEVWLLAKIRFFIKPRIRIWDQTGLQELVTITAPKKIEQVLTNGLNEYQVKSRLEALAETIDTRGWAVKGVGSATYSSMTTPQATDRLLSPTVSSPQVPDYSVSTNDDMLDFQNNPIAQHMDELVRASDQNRKQQILARMQQIRSGDPAPQPIQQPVAQPAQSYMQQPLNIPTPQPPASTLTAQDEQALLDKIHREDSQQLAYGHTRILEPAGTKPSANQAQINNPLPVAATPPVTQPIKPDILELANNDDLSVATIARQAGKKDQPPQDEVVISLH